MALHSYNVFYVVFSMCKLLKICCLNVNIVFNLFSERFECVYVLLSMCIMMFILLSQCLNCVCACFSIFHCFSMFILLFVWLMFFNVCVFKLKLSSSSCFNYNIHYCYCRAKNQTKSTFFTGFSFGFSDSIFISVTVLKFNIKIQSETFLYFFQRLLKFT